MNHYIGEFKNEFCSFCYSNCVYQILQSRKIENPLFYINTTFDLIFEQKADRLFNIERVLSEHALLPKYQQFEIINVIKEKEGVWKKDIELLQKYDEIIVDMDLFGLSYQNTYRVKNGMHAVVLCGYDDLLSQVKVIDNYIEVPDLEYFAGKLPLEKYIEARENRTGYKNLSDIKVKRGVIQAFIHHEQLTPNYPEMLKETWKGMRKYYISGQDGHRIRGCAALKALANSMNQLTITDTDWVLTQINELFMDIHMITQSYRLLSLYICSISEHVDVSIEQYCNVVQKLSKKLEVIKMMIYKIKISGVVSKLDKVVTKLYEVVDLSIEEKEIYFSNKTLL